MTKDKKRIGDTIKELRLKLMMTQSEFAQHIGVTYLTVNVWENHHRLPKLSLLRKISEIAGEHGVKIEERE